MTQTHSLKQFLDARRDTGRGRVVIPVIQRDFAQGRSTPDAEAVRLRFLRSLRAAIDAPSGRQLVLDFVYGAERPSRRLGETEFLPLDGQQRLTTLWLLHWYLAQREGRVADFYKLAFGGDEASADRGPRFTYEVRPSAREFFGELASRDLPGIEAAQPALTDGEIGTKTTPINDLIIEMPWFLRSWLKDPTVQACLTMLDAIHAQFHDCAGGYQRLCEPTAPAIVFHLLNLDRYGLTDDLYIKMNARGRPLTDFEVFKAELEKHLETALATPTYHVGGHPCSARDYVQSRWDTVWSDLLWPFSGPSRTYDAEGMNLIRSTSMAMTAWFGTTETAEVDGKLRALRDNRLRRFEDFRDKGCMTPGYLAALIKLLDHWAALRPALAPDAAPPLLGTLFERALVGPQRDHDGSKGLSYVELIRFAAYCRGVLVDLEESDFAEWLRYFKNLSVNSIYDEVAEARKALFSIGDFPAIMPGRALQAIGDTPSLSGFLGQQVREERIKAQLRMSHPGWGALIERAEMHPYLNGQIEFLLDFSGVIEKWTSGGETCRWQESDHVALQQRFSSYFERASLMFDEGGLTAPTAAFQSELLWERALLAFDNYLLPSKYGNHSLLAAWGRDASWKRLLRGDELAQVKRATIKEILDRLEPDDIEGSLRKVIRDACATGVWGPSESAPWRQLLVSEPAHLNYCTKRQVRLIGWREPFSQILLMSKQKRNTDHVDLFGHHLYLRLQGKYRGVKVMPTFAFYEETDHIVTLKLPGRGKSIIVRSQETEYFVYPPDGLALPPQAKPNANGAPGNPWKVCVGDIEAVIDYVVHAETQAVPEK